MFFNFYIIHFLRIQQIIKLSFYFGSLGYFLELSRWLPWSFHFTHLLYVIIVSTVYFIYTFYQFALFICILILFQQILTLVRHPGYQKIEIKINFQTIFNIFLKKNIKNNKTIENSIILSIDQVKLLSSLFVCLMTKIEALLLL